MINILRILVILCVVSLLMSCGETPAVYRTKCRYELYINNTYVICDKLNSEANGVVLGGCVVMKTMEEVPDIHQASNFIIRPIK